MFQDLTSNFCQYSKALENQGYQGSTSWLLAWDLSQLLGHPSGTQERTRLDRTDLRATPPWLKRGTRASLPKKLQPSLQVTWKSKGKERLYRNEPDVYMLVGVTVVFALETWVLAKSHWHFSTQSKHNGSGFLLVQRKRDDWLFFLHVRSLTKPMQNDAWKITFSLGRPIFRGYVKLPGSNS